MTLETTLNHFLAQHHQNGAPLLIGLSGGPDSMALFHGLLNIRQTRSFPLAVAHVNHKWRESSDREAMALKKYVEERGVSFFLKTLDPSRASGNLEDYCRRERQIFFTELQQQHGYQAVLLAHHADDQGETVLKRVLEGAGLSRLNGLQPVRQLGALTCWRPLLELRKKELLDWLEARAIPYIKDPSNDDCQFLRNRMRQELLPALSEVFGKNIEEALGRIGSEASELSEYLDRRIAPQWNSAVHGPFGSFIDLSGGCLEERVECEHLIRKLCRRYHITLSRHNLHQVVDLLKNQQADRQVVQGEHSIFVDRRRLFLMSQMPEPARWEMRVEEISAEDVNAPTSWRDLWQGRGEVVLPPGDYHLDIASGGGLRKWWSTNKTPAFLRQRIPVLLEKGEVVHEFLSGRYGKNRKEKGGRGTLAKVSVRYY